MPALMPTRPVIGKRNPVLKQTRYEFLDSRSRSFSAALGAAVGVQDRTECLDCIAMRSVVDVHASAFGLDQSGPPELGQVVAHGRLGESQGGGEVAAVFLPGRGAEQIRHDLHAGSSDERLDG